MADKNAGATVNAGSAGNSDLLATKCQTQYDQDYCHEGRKRCVGEVRSSPVGTCVGACEMLARWVLSMSGCVPITSAFSQSVPCSMFYVYKREVFFNIFPDYPCNDTNLQ